jgi:hypothetical protein
MQVIGWVWENPGHDSQTTTDAPRQREFSIFHRHNQLPPLLSVDGTENVERLFMENAGILIFTFLFAVQPNILLMMMIMRADTG